MRVFVFFLVILPAVGCKRMEANPHLLDPIYADINSELSKANKDVTDSEKAFEIAAGDTQKIEPQTGQYKLKWKAYFEAQKKLDLARQRAYYLQIRLASREHESRKAYKKSFIEGKDWPDPAEFKSYLKNKELALAPRTWDHRVPKMRSPAAAAPKEASKPSGGGGGH